jgi:hypothetical protein
MEMHLVIVELKIQELLELEILELKELQDCQMVKVLPIELLTDFILLEPL